MPELKAARAAAAGGAYFSACALHEAVGKDCCSARRQDRARYRRLQGIYDRSHLGGSDIIRLRIIDQMRYLGCPLPAAAFAHGPPYGIPGNRGAAGAPFVYK
jgi:hypothetical protein